MFTQAFAAERTPALPQAIAWKWDIWRKGNSISKEFSVVEKAAYQFLIGFAGPDAAGADGHINPKADQSWRTQFGEWNKEKGGFDGPLSLWIGDGNAVSMVKVADGENFLVLAPQLSTAPSVHRGVVVTVKVRLEKLEPSGASMVIVDRAIDTAGQMSGGQLVTRALCWARIPSGRYRLTAQVLSDSEAIPQGVNSFLYIRQSPPA